MAPCITVLQYLGGALRLGRGDRRGESNIMRVSTLAVKLGLIALLAQGAPAMAAEVKVMAGAAMSGAFGELLPQFERATGHKIAIQYGSTGAFKKQIEAGEAFDLVIFGSAGVDDLINQCKIVDKPRRDIDRLRITARV